MENLIGRQISISGVECGFYLSIIGTIEEIVKNGEQMGINRYILKIRDRDGKLVNKDICQNVLNPLVKLGECKPQEQVLVNTDVYYKLF